MLGGITGYTYNLFSSMNTESMQSQKEQKFSELDADSSGAVSKDEFQVLMDEFTEMTGFVAETEEVFSSLDTDGDESLSLAEMESSALLMGPPPPPPPMMGMNEDDSTDPLDTNGDGVVNVLDFVDESDDTDTVNPMFAEIDTDSDGLVSKSEFEVFAATVSEMTGVAIDVDASFEAADTDSDGYLTEDDMAAFMPPPPGTEATASGIDITDEKVSSVMSSLDANGDGVIEKSELKLALLEVKLQAYNNIFGQSDDSGPSSLLDLLG